MNLRSRYASSPIGCRFPPGFLDALRIPVCIANTEIQFVFVNQAWLSFRGRSLIQENGRGWTDGVHPDDLDRCLVSAFNAIVDHRHFFLEFRILNAKGEWRWFLNCGFPVFETSRKYLGYVGYSFIISEAESTYLRSFDLDSIEVQENVRAKMIQAKSSYVALQPEHVAQAAMTVIPAQLVGGDCICLSSVGSTIALAMIDSTGHSLESSIDANLVRDLVVDKFPQLLAEKHPGKLLTNINRKLCGGLLVGRYPTMLVAVIDLAVPEIVFSTAAAPAPIVFRSGHAVDLEGYQGGVHLGFLPEAVYPENRMSLQRGDIVVGHSDALTWEDVVALPIEGGTAENVLQGLVHEISAKQIGVVDDLSLVVVTI